MFLTLGLGQFYSKKMQLEKNVLWHLQVGSCNPEKHYSTIERECFAIVWGITKFQEYVYGTELFLETDHDPLQYIRRAKFHNGRLMRWVLALQPHRILLCAI